MSKRRKSNSMHPARAANAARRFRVQREDGVILAEHLERKKAEAIAASLFEQHTGMRYVIKEEIVGGAPVVSIQEFLETQKGTPTNVPTYPPTGSENA